MFAKVPFTILLGLGLAGQSLLADDFNRPNVAYSNDGAKLGWYWQASGAGNWSLTTHEILANNSSSSLQQSDQTLYHTRVSLIPGAWSASVDVRSDTSNRWLGFVFMVGAAGMDHYQIRLKSGSNEVQVLQRGSGGSQNISLGNVSTETFATGKFYKISAWSTVVNQTNWNVKNPAGVIVASGSFIDSTYTTGYAGIIKSAGDPSADSCRFDNFYVREITVPPITQPHPRILVTSADVANMQGAIDAKIEPRYSAWLDLKGRADAWSDDAVSAPYTGRDSSLFFAQARSAGSLSSKMALAWLLKRDFNHAAKAKEILLTWAQATPLPGTDFDPNIRFANSGMELARSINGFIFAYDYLHDVLSPTERTVVETWFRAMLPSIQEGIDRWDAPFRRNTGDPRGYSESPNLNDIYFHGQLYQNHLVSHTMGHLLIGYALGDQALVQFAVDSPENPRDFLELFEGIILMAGDPSANSGDPMNPPPQDGEIIDRYRHIDTGDGHPNGAGLAYASLSLHQMMAMSETLFANGLDFYQRTGAYGETLEKPFEFYADFYRLGDDTIKGGFYTGEGVTAGSYPVAVFEVANKRYPENPEIKELLDSVARYDVDPSGYMETYFCYPTLTHGVVASWTGATTSDFQTAANWEAGLPVNDISTEIAHFDITPLNQPQLTADRAVAGLEFGVSGITLTAASTQALTLGASGIISNGSNTISAALNLAASQSWNVSTGSKLIVAGAIAGAADLTKTGNGTLALSSANTHSGRIMLNVGKIELNSAQGSSGPLTVGSGTTLAMTLAGTSQWSPSNITLDGAAGLEFSGVTSTTTAPITTGTLAKNGSTAIHILSGVFATGQSYPLVQFTTTTGSGEFTIGSLPTGVVANLSTSGNTLFLNIISPVPFTWVGNINGSWDTTVANWNNGTGVASYINGARVAFNDTATGPTTVTMASAVSPGAMLVNNSIKNYTLSGPISGIGGLTKNGSGNLTLSGANTYTGGSNVTAGSLTIGIASTKNLSTLISGATGKGNVSLSGGVTLAQSSNIWYAPQVTLQGNITLTGTSRQSVGFSTLDLAGGSRTISIHPTGGLIQQTIAANIALEGSGRSRWEMQNDLGAMTVQNGKLILATNLTGNAYAGFMFRHATSFANNTEVTVGANVHLQTADAGSLGSTTANSAQLNVIGIWNLFGTFGGAAGQGNQTIHSLAGSGKVYASMVATNVNSRTITINGTSGSTEFSGQLSNGPGTGKLSILKTGASTQIFTGMNSYTGDTTVSGGVLGVNGSSIADASSLIITGGKVQVTNTEIVDTLFFGATQQASGSYGSTASLAIYKNNTRFSGTGVVVVGQQIGLGYSSAMTTHGLVQANQNPTDDPDHDGLSNLMEYVLGGIPNVSDTASIAPLGTIVGSNYILTFKRSDLSEVDTIQTVEYGSDLNLGGSYTIGASPGISPVVVQEDVPSADLDTVTVTIPTGGAPGFFVRLKVVK